jgi:hypothetical protein
MADSLPEPRRFHRLTMNVSAPTALTDAEVFSLVEDALRSSPVGFRDIAIAERAETYDRT